MRRSLIGVVAVLATALSAGAVEYAVVTAPSVLPDGSFVSWSCPHHGARRPPDGYPGAYLIRPWAGVNTRVLTPGTVHRPRIRAG